MSTMDDFKKFLNDAFDNITRVSEGIDAFANATAILSAPLVSLVNTLVDLNEQMNQLKRVMNEDTNFEEMLQSNINAAYEFGSTLSQINELAVTLARQNFSELEVADLAQSVTLAQNVMDLDQQAAISAITSAMDSFNIKASESISIVDKLNELSNNFTVSSQELSLAMQASATDANLFGVSLDSLLGDSTAIMQATKISGDAAGAALNTIYSSLTNSKPAIDALKSIRVDVKNANGEFKSATQILDEVALAYENLNDQTRQNVAVAIAGHEQHASFVALMEQRRIAHEAAAMAMNAENSAMSENAVYMQSTEANINLMKTAWQEFSLVLGDNGINTAIVLTTKAIVTLLDTLSALVQAYGALPLSIGVATTLLFAFSSSFRKVTVVVYELITGIRTLSSVSVMAAGAFRALAASTGVGLAFVAISMALEGIFKLFSNANDSQHTFFSELQNNIKETKSQIDQLNITANQLNNQTATQDQLLDTYKELSMTIPGVISHFDAQGNAVYKTREEILKLIQVQKELLALKLENQALESFNLLGGILEDAEKAEKKIGKLNDQFNQNQAYLEAYQKLSQFKAENGSEYSEISSQKKEALKQSLSETFQDRNLAGTSTETNFLGQLHNVFSQDADNMIKFYADRNNKLQIKINDTRQTIINGEQSITQAFQNLVDSEYANNNFEDQNVQILFQNIADSILSSSDVTSENFEKVKIDFQAKLDEISELIKNGTIDVSAMFKTGDFSELTKYFPDLKNVLDTTAQSVSANLKNMKKEIQVFNSEGKLLGKYPDLAAATADGLKVVEDSMQYLSDGTVKYTGSYQYLSDTMDNSVTSLNGLTSAYQTLASGQSLSNNTIADLIGKYPQLAKYLAENKDLTFQNGEMIKDVAEIERLAKLQNYQNALESVEIKKNELERKQNLYKQYYQNYLDAGYPIDNWMLSSGLTKEEQERLNAYTEDANLLKAAIQIFSQPLDLTPPKKNSNTSTSASSEPAKNSDPAKIEDDIEALIRSKNKLADEQAKTNEDLLQAIESYMNRNDFADAMQANNQLIKGYKKEINLLIGANKQLDTERAKLKSPSSKYPIEQWIDKNGEATLSFYELYNSMNSGSAQDSLQELFDEYQKLTGAINDNKQSISELYIEISTATDRTLELIQSATEKITSKSDRKISLLGNINTQEEKDKLVNYQQEITDALRKESAQIFNEINKLNAIINDPGSSLELKTAAQESLKSYLDAANETNLELVKSAETLGASQADAIIFGFTNTIEDLEYERSLLTNSDEDVKKAEQLDHSIYLIRLNAKSDLNKRIIALEQELTNAVNNEQRMRLQTELEQLQSFYKSNNVELANAAKSELDKRAQFADKVIDNYKKLLEKEKKLKKDAIDHERKLENQRHEDKINKLTEEYELHEKMISAQLKALDSSFENEDNEEQLTKLVNERAEIDNKISVLALDDSFEAKAKRKALEEELALKDEEIVKFQRDREREIRRQGLQEQLDDRKEAIDQEKKLEDEKHNLELERLDNLSDENERYYEGIFNNEQAFYLMKQELMSNDLEAVQTQLDTISKKYDSFFSDLTANSHLYSDQIRNNLLYALGMDKDYANTGTETNGSKGQTGNSVLKTEKQKAWEEYLSNKQRAESLGANRGTEFQALKARNDQLRAEWDFTDGSYNKLKDMQVYHNGGEVGVNGTSTENWWTNILKSNEVPAILRKSEVILNEPANFLNHLASNVQSNLNNLVQRLTPSPASSIANHYSVNIDKVIGDESGARMITDTIGQAFKNMMRTGRV